LEEYRKSLLTPSNFLGCLAAVPAEAALDGEGDAAGAL